MNQHSGFKKQGRVTLKDLAQSLNLSPATVSRALNNFPEINEKTKERVKSKAIELGYTPDRNAQRLASGKANAIGLVVPHDRDISLEPQFGQFIAGMCEYAGLHGLDIMLCPANETNELTVYKNTAKQHAVDGFIVSSPELYDNRIDTLNTLGIPYIVHGRTSENNHSWLDINNVDSFCAGTEYLIDHGHKNIALMGSTLSQTFAFHRQKGYIKALTKNNIQINPDFIIEGKMTESAGYKHAKRLLTSDVKPSAFISTSMFVTLGIIRASRELGLRYPEDFSIISHDDETPYLQAEFFNPPISTLNSSIKEAGFRCTELLHKISNGSISHKVEELWEINVVNRSSVGKPKNINS